LHNDRFLDGSALAGHHEKGEMSSQTIVEVAIGAEQVSTLVTAIEAAGLVETLSGEGPFTVFAPTNEAFANLPEGALEGLLADTEKLTAVLTAHVASGKVKASEVVNMTEVETLNGTLEIAVNDGSVTVGNAAVVATDIMGSNGVIHLIDTVIIPE
tara:strand:- start:684 stop:1151 length:468 start_codon:yes stop_codon:yes gene_type:complete